MNASSRLHEFWQSVRPRTRRGAALGVIGILAGAAVLSIALFAGAVMAWSPYLEFSLHRDVDARSAAALEPTYASAGMCARCHAAELERATSAKHAEIGCESCHGPLLRHSLAGPDDAGDTVTIAVPTDAVCIRCHVRADGRPAGFRQIEPDQHYVSVCLQCHDPHTGIARRPPIVEHPLANLPPCLTCHGPEGFKARNQRHPAGSSDDKPCLDCHAPGRGPDDGRVSE